MRFFSFSLRPVLILLLLALPFLGLEAQRLYRSYTTFRPLSHSARVAARYGLALDSLSRAYARWSYSESDTLSNPYYATLFGSPTLYGSTLARLMELPAVAEDTLAEGEGLVATSRLSRMIELGDRALAETYMYRPWLIAHEEAENGTMDVDDRIRESVIPKESLTERFSEKAPVTEAFPLVGTGTGEEGMAIVVQKPNFWDFKTNFSFQFTQSFVSDNWYKGGESNYAMLASAVIDANYDNKQRLRFDNRLEMKIGFQTSANDTEHKFRTNSDLIRLTNKFGLRAVKYWYYTVMLQSWTQFYRGYQANDKTVYSDFMSPFESLLSVGMDFKWNSKKNKFNVTATLSPVAVKLVYCDRDKIVTRFGIDEGHNSVWTFGSNITVNYTWKIINHVSWQGRIYFFTDYSKTQVEWENTFNFSINKYLSARLFLYPRFDDSVKENKDKKYMQFNELLSLGLNLNF